MKEATVKKRIGELLELTSDVPQAGVKVADPGAGIYIPAGPKGEAATDDLIDELRMRLKYLKFDVEATRRENRYLRQMLETRFPRKPDKDQDSPE